MENLSGKVNLSQLRNLVRSYIDRHLYETALFWADKAMALSNGELQDVYWFAQGLFYTQQYQRAVFTLTSRKLHETSMACRYLVGKCYAECKKWQDALDVLEIEQKDLKEVSLSESLGTGSKKLESAIQLLRGFIYKAMENVCMSIECFKEALRLDVYCYEAFDQLISHYMLSSSEEVELINSLPFEEQCLPEEITLLKYFYENKLQINAKHPAISSPAYEPLNKSLDVIVGLAEKHFANYDYKSCHGITSHVLQNDPLHSACLPLHISCLVELKKSNDLFYLGHKLVDHYPHQATSWYAVACYYYLIAKYESARRFFSKATTIEKTFGPAWIGFGHAFATEGEHDQAMSAYFTASKLMPGAYQPLLYIGMEYTKTNNCKLAERFFNQALTISSNDPFTKHEIGQIAFQNGQYAKAEKYFKEALEKVQNSNKEVLLETWEPLLNNLGHTVRKLGRYEEAMVFHQKALVLMPQNSSTLSAIGFLHSLLGNYEKAMSYFHNALSLRKDDTFSVQMLGHSLEQFSMEIIPEGETQSVDELILNSCKQYDESNEENSIDVSMEI